jgi:hypothetical protein
MTTAGFFFMLGGLASLIGGFRLFGRIYRVVRQSARRRGFSDPISDFGVERPVRGAAWLDVLCVAVGAPMMVIASRYL